MPARISIFAAIILLAGTSSARILLSQELLQRRDQIEERFRRRCLEIIGQPAFGDRAAAYRQRLDEIRRFPNENLHFLVAGSFLGDDDDGTPLADLVAQHAADLAELAQAALGQNNPSLAYQLLYEAAFFDRQQPIAQRVLGLSSVEKREQLQVRRATTEHPRLGWNPSKYWRIDTEHYQIVTNQSEQAGLQLARRLEDLHTVWRQLFFDCWSNQASLAGALRRKRPLRPRSKTHHRVVLFASRDEYIQHLRPRQPRIDITLGFYDVDARTSFFFAGPDASPATQLHEASHQLFQELQRSSPRMAADRNFWIVEGVALYMESLRRRGPCVAVGGFYANRLQYARYRRLQENFYVPLSDLASFGREALQRDTRIRRIYSQAAGLTHFLMDGQSGRHRAGLIQYLRQVYQGRDRLDELERSTATSYAMLDQQYQSFLDVSDEDLKTTSLTAHTIQSLCLGKTAVSDEGLIQLAPQAKLEWLDLAHTSTTDRGLGFMRGAQRLRQVNLDATAVTDRSLGLLAKCPRLEEIDLSRTRITDAGIPLLHSLPNLRVLWLTNTTVSDESIDALARLKALQQLDVQGTRITRQGRQRLRQQLPNLSVDE